MREKIINFRFLYFQKAFVFHRWGNHTDDSAIQSYFAGSCYLSGKITSLIYFPCMRKICYIYWGAYQSVGTHLFQDNLAPEILLMTFTFKWIAKTEYTEVTWLPVS